MKSLIGPVVWKEAREIRRDPVTIAVAILLPLIMLYLFGAGLSLDVEEARLAVYDQDRSPASRALIDAFPRSGYFRLAHEIRAEHEIGELLDRGRVRLVLVIPEGFARRLARREPAVVQTLVDGSFSATAMVVVGYAEAVVQSFALAQTPAGKSVPLPVVLDARVWFNAPLESVNYIVPGLFGVILMAFPPLLTALAVVREKEAGSVQQIFVSPIRPFEFIAGKAIPYAGIAFLEMLLILAAGLWWFEVPFRGSLPLFLAATLIYVVCTVGLGLLISSVTRSQLVAMLLALVLTLMPSFLFSGFLFPIYTMPAMMQLYTYLFPARYFIEISRGIAMKDVGLAVLWPQFALLVLYTAVVFAFTTRLFRKKVG
ncbi:ABC transporter permease [Sulfurifustis variabilis]|uniref:ABC transporter permease n=1 Tax=Sulfurifustis variabilis TaxID=1675686 RepID=A0A1C7AF11_9GAMM|nr:ABC transporter permease [Sulfurifustis variabilis]BAU49803.1 ABC transporter permease [Sulfurifustis variabilis]